ncbi:ATP-dependent DNA ligase [Verrucomicrobiota bacterium sgz303538]
MKKQFTFYNGSGDSGNDTRLVHEQTAKGYSPGAGGISYQQANRVNQDTGMHCQLLTPAGEEQVEQLIADPNYWMQEMFDGRRLLIKKEGETITGINRLGLVAPLPAPLVRDISRCPFDLLLDGEAIGDMICAFDLLQIGDEQITGLRYRQRYLRLMNALALFQHPHIHIPETHFHAKDKRDAFYRLKNAGCEGVVFKYIDASYTPGRPASGCSQLKYKFHETASFIVGKVGTNRSVLLLLFHGEKIVAAGNVTIPLEQEIPTAGQIVECRYLYAFRESGCIFQPGYLGRRDDVRSEECTTAQLKYKAPSAEEAQCEQEKAA